MTAHINLLRNGYEAVAEHVAKIARRNRGAIYAVIRESGLVRCEQAARLQRALECEHWFIVGPYDRSVRVEWCEDDLL